MPALSFEALVGSEEMATIRLRGDPGEFFGVQIAAAKFFFDLTLLRIPIDMVLLLGIDPNLNIGVGVLDAAGSGAVTFPIPPLQELWGMGLPLQAVALNPATFFGRWTNVRDLLIVP
jgi:hypothetical protein